MTHNPKTRFFELVNSETPREGLLPFIHITDAYSFSEILAPKKLIAQECDVFNEHILYMFYGKPAYRTKHGGSSYLSAHLPCVFLLDPNKFKDKISRIFPFDTGAFSSKLYNRYFHPKTKLDDFELGSEHEVINKLVDFFYIDDKEYYTGASRKNAAIPSTNFEAEGYFELARAPADPDRPSNISPDERASAIELQFKRDIDLINSVEACIIPVNILDDKQISKELEIINPRIIKTYLPLNKFSPEGIAGQLYQITYDIFISEGYIK